LYNSLREQYEVIVEAARPSAAPATARQ
jgi:hypothetical protein